RRGGRTQHARRVGSQEKRTKADADERIPDCPKEAYRPKEGGTNILAVMRLFRGAHAPRVPFPAPRRKHPKMPTDPMRPNRPNPFTFPGSSRSPSHPTLDLPSSVSARISLVRRSFRN